MLPELLMLFYIAWGDSNSGSDICSSRRFMKRYTSSSWDYPWWMTDAGSGPGLVVTVVGWPPYVRRGHKVLWLARLSSGRSRLCSHPHPPWPRLPWNRPQSIVTIASATLLFTCFSSWRSLLLEMTRMGRVELTDETIPFDLRCPMMDLRKLRTSVNESGSLMA